jgi:transglutaminase-like putative cysteine protease
MRIAVTHLTRLDFDEEVNETIMDAHLGPFDDADQHVERYSLRMEPAGHIRRYEDGFGNVAHLVTNSRPHASLLLSAECEVQTYVVDPFLPPARPPRELDAIALADGLSPSPLVPHLEIVDQISEPFRSTHVFDTVRRMSEMIYRDFQYRQNVTDVKTSIEQVLTGRQGVCQDFAHLLLGMCRALEIPARYASGYIVTREAGSDAPAPSRGEGASHAWVEAFSPSHGWRGFDPTNNLVANEHYVKIAVGRDYSDVPPTRGTYHGGSTERLSVAVSTRILD